MITKFDSFKATIVLACISLSLVGGIISAIQASAAEWTYTYDVMDRVKTATDPLGRVENYSYDLAGNLTQFTDRKGQGTILTYDPLNRVSRIQYADNSTVGLVYDTANRLDSVTDSVSGTISFGYDILNRVIRETTSLGLISYSYDLLGRRTSMTVAGYAPVAYRYDAASRLTHVTQGNQTVIIGYDAAGRRTTLIYPNGTVTTYAYDSASRLTTLVHALGASTVESLSYSYDAAGNRVAAQRGQGATGSLPPSAQAAYDAANQQTKLNSTTPNLTYDANGNLTSWTETSGTITYTWDVRNRLVAINGPAIAASFVYDAFNRRIGKTVNGVTRQYLYDRYDIVAEVGSGAYLATYLRGLNIDEPFARYAAGTTLSAEFYHADGLGSTVALTDLAGTVQTTYTYEPFGVTAVAGTSSANPFQFAGRENDGATGLYYNRMRYYSPAVHRFIQEDPIGFEGGDVNLYAFVGNNPLRYVDPFGLDKSDHCPSFSNRYLDHILTYTIDLGPYAAALGGGLWPKSWAPATAGRGPFLGSINPLTSVPRALGIPGAGTATVQTTAATIGVATVGIGFYNIGVFTSSLVYAIPSSCE